MDGLCRKKSHILYITQVLYIIHMYIMLNLFNTIRFFYLMQIILYTFYWGDGRIDSLLQSVAGPWDSTLGKVKGQKLTTKKNIKECVCFLLLLGKVFPNPSDYYLFFFSFFFFFTWVVSNEFFLLSMGCDP